MEQLRKICFILTFITIISITANAQQNTASAGGNYTGSGGSISFSIGQANYTYHSNAFGSVNQGVQQPYEIFPVGFTEHQENTIGERGDRFFSHLKPVGNDLLVDMER